MVGVWKLVEELLPATKDRDGGKASRGAGTARAKAWQQRDAGVLRKQNNQVRLVFDRKH